MNTRLLLLCVLLSLFREISEGQTIFIGSFPSNTIAPTGGSATFKVWAESSNPLFYQWQRNGTNVPNATRTNVTLSNLTTNDISSFRVIVSNISMVVTSPVAGLSIYPSNLVPVRTTLIGAGFSSVAPTGVFSGFNCFAYPSNTQVTLSTRSEPGWRLLELSGTCHSTNTTCNDAELISNLVRIGHVLDTNSDYSIRITNTFNFRADAVRLVTVKFSPIRPFIIEHPRSQMVRVGSNITLTVQTKGEALSFQWYSDFRFLGDETNSSLAFPNASEDQSDTYWVTVKNDAGEVTSEKASLVVYTPPTNDSFSNRTVLSGPFVRAHGASIEATREAGEPSHATAGGASVWWTWRAPISGLTSIDTVGSKFDTLLSVYTGSALTNLVLLTGDDQGGGNDTSKVVFNAVAGTDYQISVSGFENSTGVLDLTIRPPRPVLVLEYVDDRFFVARIFGQPNTQFVGETSTNLITWTPYETNSLSINGDGLTFRPTQTNEAQRFFPVEVTVTLDALHIPE